MLEEQLRKFMSLNTCLDVGDKTSRFVQRLCSQILPLWFDASMIALMAVLFFLTIICNKLMADGCLFCFRFLEMLIWRVMAQHRKITR